VIADGLIEIAAEEFTDIAPMEGAGHRFYRVIGNSTIKFGEIFELELITFEGIGGKRTVVTKGGIIDPAIAAQYTPRYADIMRIPDGVGQKLVSQSHSELDQIFRNGAYAFFPSSRSEIPHWANEQTPDNFSGFESAIVKQLRKPIIVESALSKLKPWLLDILLDASLDVGLVLEATTLQMVKEAAVQLSAPLLSLETVNDVLRRITGNPDVRIVRAGRFSANQKLQIMRSGQTFIPTLESLSAGQASLFSIFATIARYGDAGRFAQPDCNITGIVCIDEVDSHLHPSLQYNGLPNLIRLFPRVQFFISSHSPLFPLGMKEKFGEDGFTLLEMPEARKIPVERYEDFLHAFRFFERTKTFEREVEKLSKAGGLPLIICEGETDPTYLSTAARVLGFRRLVEEAVFDWVGVKTAAGGTTGGGKNNLDDAFKILSNNPTLITRKIILLYDGDTQTPEKNQRDLHVRMMHRNPDNNRADGIENLLPVAVLEERFYQTTCSRSGTTFIQKKVLDKTALCTELCQRQEEATFEGFRPVLQQLEKLLFPASAAP
jgi:hypothetical protein